MYTVLLSGGSGKRLWPLSNDLRSKQYIKLLTKEDDSAAVCSMVQRVMGQLYTADLSESTVICASAGQVEMLRNQLGNVNIAIEPERRDTFPAVALSCAYLVSKLGANADDILCVLPVDPYTEVSYFETLKKLAEVVRQTGCEIALMGAVPTYPSTKYGYIVPAAEKSGYFDVSCFKEKPDVQGAEALLAQKALWNCGVFCFKIGNILDRLSAYGLDADYDVLYREYNRLPKISFDYEVLEKARNLSVVPFNGLWKDLGTWNALCEEMHDSDHGFVVMDKSCADTHVINELNIPVVAIGLKDVVVVASFDGILVADKSGCDNVKNVIQDINLQPMYEERRWGTIKTIDVSQVGDKQTVTRKITIFANMNSSYHYHNNRDEIWTVMRGEAELLVEGTSMILAPGSAVSIKRGQKHAIKAKEEFEYMEIHLGETAGDQDINRITFDWDAVPRTKLL